jgi:hypothetical protein
MATAGDTLTLLVGAAGRVALAARAAECVGAAGRRVSHGLENGAPWPSAKLTRCSQRALPHRSMNHTASSLALESRGVARGVAELGDGAPPRWG